MCKALSIMSRALDFAHEESLLWKRARRNAARRAFARRL